MFLMNRPFCSVGNHDQDLWQNIKMEIEFKIYTNTDKPDVLEMMEAFNKIDGYDFDLTMGEKPTGLYFK